MSKHYLLCYIAVFLGMALSFFTGDDQTLLKAIFYIVLSFPTAWLFLGIVNFIKKKRKP